MASKLKTIMHWCIIRVDGKITIKIHKDYLDKFPLDQSNIYLVAVLQTMGEEHVS